MKNLLTNRAFIGSVVGAFVLALGIVVFQEQGNFQAFENGPSTSALVRHGQINTDTGYVLLKTDDAKLKGNLEKQEHLTKDTAAAATLDKIGVARYKVSDDDTAGEVAGRLTAALKAAHPAAAATSQFAEVDALVGPSLIPNDTNYPNEWHLPKINAPTAWDTTTANSNIIIGIADTGVDPTHPDLAAHLVPGYNFYDKTTDTSDVYGHGTGVAGTAAAIGNNAKQVAGVAFNASIMPLRVSDANGYATFSTIASAVTWAADHGARVVNNSYNSYPSTTVASAGNYLRSKGGLLTIAAGNDGTVNNYPNSADDIVVSATDSFDTLASWSTFGPAVDMSAPGVNIYLTTKGGGIGSGSGTSFAAPIVAGTLGLIYAANPSQFTADINGANLAESILETSAHDLATTGWDDHYGWGRVDAGAAVAKAVSTVTTTDTTAPSIPTGVKATAKSSSSIGLSWLAATDNVGVSGYQVFRDGTQIATINSLTYADNTLTASTTYSYTVKAYDSAGNVSAGSTAASATTLNTGVAFVSLTVSSKTATSAIVTSITTLASTANITCNAKGKAPITQADVTASTAHTINLAGLASGTSYSCQEKVTAPADGSTASLSFNFRTLRK
jgi:thermitase